MNHVVICQKCGNITDENEYYKEEKYFKKQKECWKCHSIDAGVIINLDSDNLKKIYQNRVKEKYGDKFDDFPFPLSRYLYYQEELIREDFYYGKLDSQKDYSAFKDREQFEKDYLDGKILESNYHVNVQSSSNVPKCPICGSTNLKKITGTRKAMKIGLFGLFGAGDLGKTYQCGQCGAKF